MGWGLACVIAAVVTCVTATAPPSMPSPSPTPYQESVPVQEPDLLSAHHPRLLGTLGDHDGSVRALALYENILFSGSQDRTIKVWDLTDMSSVGTIVGHKDKLSDLLVAEELNLLFSASYDRVVKVWTLDTYEHVVDLEGHTGMIYALAMSAPIKESGEKYSAKLFSASYDRHILVWDLDTFELVGVLEGHKSDIYCLGVSGTKLFSGSRDKTIRVWDIKTLKEIDVINDSHGDSILAMAVTPDGSTIFTGSRDGSVAAVDVASHEILHTLVGHNHVVKSLHIFVDSREESEDNLRLLSGSWDGEALLWDISSPSPHIIDVLLGHRDGVISLAWSDGLILTGSGDHTINVWDDRGHHHDNKGSIGDGAKRVESRQDHHRLHPKHFSHLEDSTSIDEDTLIAEAIKYRQAKHAKQQS